MPFPIMGALMLGSALAKGLLKGKQQQAVAGEDKKAQELRKKQHEALQARRAARVGGVQEQLQGVQGSLPEGAPSYAYSPETLAALQEAVPWAPAEGTVADPTKGSGWALAGGLAEGVGGIAKDILMGQAEEGAPSSSVAPASMELPDVVNPFQPEPIDTALQAPALTDWSRIFGPQVEEEVG